MEPRSASDERPAILLVEDDEGLRPILARHLRLAGYGVTEAESAEAAVSALEAGVSPALIVLDLNLPGDTGWDLLRSRAVEAAGSPPVVITSAVTVSPRQLREFGVAGYLPKPFPLETLLQTVERIISSSRKDGATNPMSDLAALAVLAVSFLALFGLIAICDVVRR